MRLDIREKYSDRTKHWMGFHELTHVEIPHSMKYSIEPRSNTALENEPMNFAANKPHSGINCCA